MHVYLGLSAVAFSALSLEVSMVRLLSITTFYHLAFFAVSTAMLGITAGATRVYLQPNMFARDNLEKALSTACIHLSLSIPAMLVMLCLVPLNMYELGAMNLLSLFVTTAVCAFPFYFVGTIVSAVLTKYDLPIGGLYASDLIGASLGCLFVLGSLEFLDVPSLILLCGATSAFGGLCFVREAPWKYRGTLAGLLMILLVGGGLNSLSPKGIRPFVLKGERIEPASYYLVDCWNSFSRVAVYPGIRGRPQYWGPSPLAPSDDIDQYKMNIDGAASTHMRRFDSEKDIDHLRYDVANVAYHLGRTGEACIIGVGGGRDVQSAILFGCRHVTGVEINPIFIDLLRGPYRAFAGIAGRPDVTLVTAEARSYLSRQSKKYSIIQMSLIDTWALTGVGAFSLSENALYTVEAWNLFLDRLSDDGIFTVSRWHSPQQISETGRVLALAAGTLLRRGIQRPSDHLALISIGNISTLLVARRPFTPADVDRVQTVCQEYRFQPILFPGHPPPTPLLRQILAARTYEELLAATRDGELRCDPTTDEDPYFFNMLRLSNLGAAFAESEGIISGNLVATLTLCGLIFTLLVLAAATIVIPLLLSERREANAPGSSLALWWGAIYFSLIGAAFMLIEIALIQRLTVLLSHPIYALGVILFTIIASTGVGSLLSDRLPLCRRPWAYVFPVVTVAYIIGIRFALTVLLRNMVAESELAKIVASVAVIFPMGLLMGMFFPTGMRLAKSVCPGDTPWFWALNGIFGVLFSAIAVLISIYAGISANFYIAAGCYAAVLIPLEGLRRRANTPEVAAFKEQP
jgi:hypothetical protein